MFVKRKSVIGILLAIVMIFSLSACTQTPQAPKSPDAKQQGEAPKATKEEVLKIGVDDVYPPMEFKDDKGTTVGFDIDLGQEIGKKMNRKVELVSTAWDGIFLSLDTKKFDCIISSVSINEERQQKYSFTKPYIANSQVIVVSPKNTTINTEKDLAGKKVGVQTGTTADESCEKFLETIKFEVKKYDQVIQPFADLKTGRLDAVVVDEVVAKYYVTQDKENFKVTGGRLTNEPIGICFRKDDTQLRDQVQKAIDDLKADGTMKKISEKWFGEDLTANVK